MINKYFNKNKSSDKYCPRCGEKTVRKDIRKCFACGKRLLWSGDDFASVIYKMDHFYIWLKTNEAPKGGWFDMSYVGIDYGDPHYHRNH